MPQVKSQRRETEYALRAQRPSFIDSRNSERYVSSVYLTEAERTYRLTFWIETMPSTVPRRDLLRLCGVALGFGTVGCLRSSTTENGSREPIERDSTTPNSTTTQVRSTTSERTMRAAADVPDEEAKERALTAEEEYLTEQFQNASCLTNWGTYPTTANKRATIVERSADGVYVEVVHPFSYTTEQTEAEGGSREREEADGGSNALYLVTASSIERVRGDSVTPC